MNEQQNNESYPNPSSYPALEKVCHQLQRLISVHDRLLMLPEYLVLSVEKHIQFLTTLIPFVVTKFESDEAICRKLHNDSLLISEEGVMVDCESYFDDVPS